MKIGINLNGVSYHDGSNYRKRIYTDSIDNLMKNVVNPLKEKGHEVSFYVFTYDTEKSKDVEKDYNPVKSTYVSESYKFNQATSGDRLSNGWRMMTITTVNSLHQLKEEDLDLVISTRFDINFKQNPFEVYDYDFTKCSFLWREPEFMDLPIVNDTFIVFPYHMLDNMIESFVEQEVNPPGGVNPGNHNLYVPMVKRVGEDNVVWVQEGFGEKTVDNDLYKLEREEK
tara:strand:- start:332 stop:1012 length:681 start_codon:yes stop_codon:yes gene_type:complete